MTRKPSNIMSISSSVDEFVTNNSMEGPKFISSNKRPQISLMPKTDRVHKIEKIQFIGIGGGKKNKS